MAKRRVILKADQLPLGVADFQFTVGRLLILITLSAILLSIGASIGFDGKILNLQVILIVVLALSAILFYDQSGTIVQGGHLAVQVGDYMRAIELYTQAIDKNESRADRYCYRGAAYVKVANFDAAINDFSAAISRNANYVQAWESRAMAETRRRNYQAAIDDATVALSLAPNRVKIRLVRASAYRALGQWQDAFADCDIVLLDSPQVWAAYAVRARAYFGMGDYDACIRDFASVPLDEKKPGWQTSVAFAQFRKGNYKIAFKDLDKTLQANPSSYDYGMAAWFLATCPVDEYRHGGLALEMAKKCQPNNHVEELQMQLAFAAAYAELGQFDEAVVYARKAVELSSPVNRVRCEKYLACCAARQPWRDGVRAADSL
jgi:tetratricopeptide (TPR) repeat protein